AAILRGQLDHPPHQGLLAVRGEGPPPLGGARLPEDRARPALGDAVGAQHPPDMLDRGPPLRRAQTFPAAASRRMAWSSSASDTSRLRRAFARSSSLSRWAGSVRSPPYPLRQR